MRAYFKSMEARHFLVFSFAATVAMTLVFGALILSEVRDSRPPAAEDSEQTGRPLTIAVVRLVGGWAAWPSHMDALQHISLSLGRPVHVKFLAPGEHAEEPFSQNEHVDAAFMSTFAYLIARDNYEDMTHLAAPIIGGYASEQAVLVVSAKSPHTSISDLRGARLALSPPGVGGSIPGNAYARWVLYQKGLGTAEEFFGTVDERFTQDVNLRRVLNGLADATSANRSQLASWPKGSFRVIEHSHEYAMPPFVVSPNLSDSEAEKIIDALITYRPDSEDDILGGYTRPKPEDYDFPKELLSFARGKGGIEGAGSE